MSIYRTSLLAFASLLPIALAMPAQASNADKENFRPSPPILKKKDDVTRVIQSQKVSASGCQWYNFHQSISLWPTYAACDGKSSKEVRDYYHFSAEKIPSPMSVHSRNGFSRNALKLMEKQTGGAHAAVNMYIDGNQHEAFQCSWFNYIESRHRTPLYVKCGGKDNKSSYGRYSAPDFLKDFDVSYPKDATPRQIALARVKAEREWEARQTGPAPDVVKALNEKGLLTKHVGDTSISMSRCEWSNFFQSIKFLPRFIECQASTHAAQLANYDGFKNLNKIVFTPNIHEDSISRPNALSRDHSEFAKMIKLNVGTKEVEASACDWYNLVQTEVRWPIYRDCPTKGGRPGFKPQERPVADVMVNHRLPYSN